MLEVFEGGQGQGYRRCTGLKLGFPGKLDVLFLLTAHCFIVIDIHTAHHTGAEDSCLDNGRTWRAAAHNSHGLCTHGQGRDGVGFPTAPGQAVSERQAPTQVVLHKH